MVIAKKHTMMNTQFLSLVQILGVYTFEDLLWYLTIFAPINAHVSIYDDL